MIRETDDAVRALGGDAMTEPMQRFAVLDARQDQHGPFVLASDAEAAIAAAEQRGREYEHKRLTNHDMHSGLACLTNYAQGQRDMLTRLQSKCAKNKHHDCVCDLGGSDE